MLAGEWDYESGGVETKAFKALPPSKTLNNYFFTLASALIVATYVEDGQRLLFQWNDQSSFVVGRFGSALGGLALLLIGVAQLCSLGLLVPPSIHPALPRGLKVLTAVIATSVLVQPYVFDQMDNFDHGDYSSSSSPAQALPERAQALPQTP